MRLLEQEIGQPTQLVFLDLEGTGTKANEAISIGAYSYACDQHLLPIKGSKFKEYHCFINTDEPIENIIIKMTHITPAKLKREGIAFPQAIAGLVETFKAPNGPRKYITFGNNDLAMLRNSTNQDPTGKAKPFYQHIANNLFDFQGFIAKYVHGANGAFHKQSELLQIFKAEHTGIDHDALCDAKNLGSLFIQVIKRPDIMIEEFKKGMYSGKEAMKVLRPLLDALMAGRALTPAIFQQHLEVYFG